MTIKNRLEKLEKTTHLDSEFCACQRYNVHRIINPDIDRTEAEYQRLIAEAQKPEYCDQCGKQIERQLIIIEGVRGYASPEDWPTNAANDS